MQVPFFKPAIGDDECEAVVSALKSGWLTSGPNVVKFESDLSQMLSGSRAITCNSATAGLHLALAALGVGEGDEVIIPNITFSATAAAVKYVGATPVIIDVGDSLLLEAKTCENFINDRTRAIIPVHFTGEPVEIKEFEALGKSAGVDIIYDAAHAVGSYYQGKLIGSFEENPVVFSFYANKCITTGEGGCVVTRDPGLAEKISILRTHGMSRSAFDRFTTIKAKWEYDIVDLGFKYNLTDLAASVGIHQLKKSAHFQANRNELAKRYNQNLKSLPIKIYYKPRTSQRESSAHIYCIKVDPDLRNKLIDYLNENGIGTSVHYKPLSETTYWSSYVKGEVTKSRDYFSGALSIPLFPDLTIYEQDYVIAQIEQFFIEH